jgi:hypothetical protein
MSVGDGKNFFSNGFADQDVIWPKHEGPRVINYTLHVSAILGPTVLKIHEALPVNTWPNEQMYNLALELKSRYTHFADGIHPLNAIFKVIMNSEFTKITTTNESLVKLAAYFIHSLLGAPGNAAVRRERAGCLEIPLDNSFPDYIFKTFSPEATFEEGILSWLGQMNFDMQRSCRFAEISYSYLGLTPQFSRLGDIIAVLKDFDIPVVLRKEEDHYIFVGTCFVLRLMDGEAQSLVDSQQARFSEIRIR